MAWLDPLLPQLHELGETAFYVTLGVFFASLAWAIGLPLRAKGRQQHSGPHY